jgi:hypothetical protein
MSSPSADSSIASALALVFGRLSAEGHRFYEARQHGRSCARCGEAIGANEPVWRTRVGFYAGSSLNWWLGPICETCADRYGGYTRRRCCEWSARLCAGCGRPVHEVLNNVKPWRRITVCCDDCRNVARYQRARSRRANVERRCPGCGMKFMPRRWDAVICSAACRQRLYRQRHARDGGFGNSTRNSPP